MPEARGVSGTGSEAARWDMVAWRWPEKASLAFRHAMTDFPLGVLRLCREVRVLA